MDLLGMLITGLMAALPKAGPIVAIVIKDVLAAVAVATALVAVLHAVVAAGKVLVAVGLKQAAPAVDALDKDASIADGFMAKVAKVVAQLSVIPMPK